MIERKEPWFTEPAIKVLDEYLKNNRPHVYEFGMGASTVYLHDKCASLKSVDHDEVWFSKVVNELKDPINISLFSANRPYNNSITHEIDNFYDIIIIDGRDRVKCIESALPKLKPGGWLILDNSERPYYQKGIDLMKGWERTDYTQPEPDKYGFTYPDWTTSIFIKPSTFKMMVNCQEEEDFFLSHLKPNMRVLEYGCGTSTMAIAPLVKEVVSIEHNKDWYRRMADQVPDNIKIYFMPCDMEPTQDYTDGTYEDFKSYIELPIILNEKKEKFDVIFIDGRARVGCAEVCSTLGHKDTLVFIHDFNHPDEKWRRNEYYNAEKYLQRIEGIFTMWKFKIKF